MMTPEPDGGSYQDADVEVFIRKFGYADKNDKPDRLNFGGRHVVGVRCPPTGIAMQLSGIDAPDLVAADMSPLHLVREEV